MRQHAWLLPPLQGYIHTTGPVLWTVEMEIPVSDRRTSHQHPGIYHHWSSVDHRIQIVVAWIQCMALLSLGMALLHPSSRQEPQDSKPESNTI